MYDHLIGYNYKAVSKMMGDVGIAESMMVLIKDRASQDTQFEERKRHLQAA